MVSLLLTLTNSQVASEIFKNISLYENGCILNQISLKFVDNGAINNNPSIGSEKLFMKIVYLHVDTLLSVVYISTQ